LVPTSTIDGNDMKRFANPGQEIGIEEEFSAGSGTYVENGNICASVPGEVGEKERCLSVMNRITLKVAMKGSKVIGRVEDVIEPIALVQVLGVEGEGERFTKSSDYVVLHASKVKRDYVRNIHDEVKIGDIILAKIDEIRADDTKLTTVEPELGVVKAFCCRCRRPLVLKNFNLACEKCGNREYRKLSTKYRNVEAEF